METLVDLLGVVGRRSGLPVVVCCSSRDELDAVCSTVAALPYISLSSLYSDLAEEDRALILESFRYAAFKWHQHSGQLGASVHTGEEEQKSHIVVITDASLPVLASGECPLPAQVLINYELPAKKAQDQNHQVCNDDIESSKRVMLSLPRDRGSINVVARVFEMTRGKGADCKYGFVCSETKNWQCDGKGRVLMVLPLWS